MPRDGCGEPWDSQQRTLIDGTHAVVAAATAERHFQQSAKNVLLLLAVSLSCIMQTGDL